jgi:hypothetical protein
MPSAIAALSCHWHGSSIVGLVGGLYHPSINLALNEHAVERWTASVATMGLDETSHDFDPTQACQC